MIKNITSFVLKYKIQIIIIIVIFIAFSFYKNKENLTQSSSDILDNIIVIPKCKNMTPIKLFQLFNSDLDKMTQTIIDNGFLANDLSVPDNYPKIATYLVEKNIISC
mgnify:CR=1 FL=1